MKTFALVALLAIGGFVLAQDQAPEMPRPAAGEQHAWLAQLVGDWTVTMEMTMAPGAEPMRMESTESMRSIGSLWVVGEGKADMGGMPMTSMMTIGYDPAQKAFVGTWIDSMQTHLWVYRGQLDEARRTLALEAEGPSFQDPTKTSVYRDAIEVVSPDHKVLTSSVKQADGTWLQFLRADYRRKKSAEKPAK